jgi:hypothetical protein
LVAGVDAEDANVSLLSVEVCHVSNRWWLCIPRIGLLRC